MELHMQLQQLKSRVLEEGEVAVKDWSENEGMLNFLVENNFIEKPHRFVEQGYVRIPICKLIS
jgi:hypothetical protein